LHVVMQLQLDQKLAALGFNKIDSAAALGSIIGRMISPGSELQTHDWLQSRTGLGELLDHDYGSTSLDALVHHQRYVAQTSSGAGSVSGRSGADLIRFEPEHRAVRFDQHLF